jgi:hypothetical protein
MHACPSLTLVPATVNSTPLTAPVTIVALPPFPAPLPSTNRVDTCMFDHSNLPYALNHKPCLFLPTNRVVTCVFDHSNLPYALNPEPSLFLSPH